MTSTTTVSSALTEPVAREVTAMLSRGLARPVELVPWQSGASAGGLLLMAPHELTGRARDAALRSADFSWVHLTSAGTDFVDRATWPGDRLLSRSWRCYAAPLAEYALHAVLSHEWRDGPPWTVRDHRPASGPDAPPVPEATELDTAPHGLWGSRVGVAGWGAVGRRVAGVFADLGAAVHVLRRSPEASGRPGIVQTDRIADVLDADHLVIALPLTPETEGMFGRAALEAARPGLHIVNVSRAELIDQAALAQRCAAGALAATLDVTSPEPLPAGHPLRAAASVRLSPHIAWRSRQSALSFVHDLLDVWRALAADRGEVPGVGAGADTRARSFVRAQERGAVDV